MKKISKKQKVILTLAIIAALSVPVGVYALMSAISNKETNQFIGGFVNAAVMEKGKEHEDSKNNVEEYKALRKKEDTVEKVVTIKNIATGSNATAMYARVKLIPTIVGEGENEGEILGGEIKIRYDFKNNTAWKVKDNTYYYTKPIEVGKESEELLTKVTIDQVIPEGYHLELKVMTDSIVTRPDSIIEDAWNIKSDFSDLQVIK